MEQKHITLGEVFTEKQLERAHAIVQLYPKHATRAIVSHLMAEITEPLIGQIDEKTGQENDPGYWAWTLAYALGRGEA